MRQLLAHLREREAAVDHFYCDHKGLVTIAIGFLVDRDGSPDAAGREIARGLTQQSGVRFVRKDGRAASVAEVEADWQRVKDLYRKNRQARLGDYARAAALRIDHAAIDSITRPLVLQYLKALYTKNPFMLSYDPKVAMAMVDVRYNAAGVRLWKQHDLWNALNPRHPAYDPGRAVLLFERTWAHRGVSRYGYRHWVRVQWLREGLMDARREKLAHMSI